jgi:hypothetical protein
MSVLSGIRHEKTLTTLSERPKLLPVKSGLMPRALNGALEEEAMKTTLCGLAAIVALVIAALGGKSITAQEKQDKYTLQIPGGLAFSEIKGYEKWQVVGPSLTDAADVIRVIVANPAMPGAPARNDPVGAKES